MCWTARIIWNKIISSQLIFSFPNLIHQGIFWVTLFSVSPLSSTTSSICCVQFLMSWAPIRFQLKVNWLVMHSDCTQLSWLSLAPARWVIFEIVLALWNKEINKQSNWTKKIHLFFAALWNWQYFGKTALCHKFTELRWIFQWTTNSCCCSKNIKTLPTSSSMHYFGETQGKMTGFYCRHVFDDKWSNGLGKRWEKYFFGNEFFMKIEKNFIWKNPRKNHNIWINFFSSKSSSKRISI